MRMTCALHCIYSGPQVDPRPATSQKYLRSHRSRMTTASISMACSQLLPDRSNDRATVKRKRVESPKSGVAVVIRDRGTSRVRLASGHRVSPPGAPRKNHTWGTRHLAGSIPDVASADPRESASADLRKSGFREP